MDAARAEGFAAVIRRYWPSLNAEDLVPDYAGIPPKITAQGAPAADFKVEGLEEHGISGVINLFGIESPVLTSSLALGQYVTALAERL